MNNYISDWNMEGDLPIIGQKNPTGADHDLVELSWRNGQVVLHSQTQRKQALNIPNEPSSRQSWHNKLSYQHPTRPCGTHGNPATNMAQDDDTVSWIHYPIEDSFEREFCSNFFSEPPSCDPIEADKPEESQMAPPKAFNSKRDLSHCGSNQLANDPDASWVSSNICNGNTATPFKAEAISEKVTETFEPTMTSSSGGSDSSFGRTCKQCTTATTSGNTSNKRKNREAEELECQSEVAELKSAAGNKSAQRSGTSRKSRAAEVHNLSERRRRDRINEKMKALQELIPHSNKTDKASMLDEAIDYLKSLQLQLQVMWMGSGMTPMMFPGVQHYMSRMGMAMGSLTVPGAMHLPPRVPVVDHHQPMVVAPTPDQPVLCQSQAFNPLNYQNHQMQSASFPEQYARFMGFHPLQTVSQPMNPYRFNSQAVQQQGQSIAQQGISNGPSSGGASIDGGLSGKNVDKE